MVRVCLGFVSDKNRKTSHAAASCVPGAEEMLMEASTEVLRIFCPAG